MEKIRIHASKLIAFAFLILGALGCQTVPKKSELAHEGTWSGATKIKDKKTGKTYSISVDVYARDEGQLRVEAKGFMGTPVAVVVVDRDETSYLIFDSKIYYRGPTSAEALYPVLQMPLHPQIFLDVLFAKPLMDHGWSCIQNSSGSRQCSQKSLDLALNWKPDGDDRKITVQHPRVEMELDLELDRAKVEAPEKAFALKIPKGFARKN